MLIMIEQRDRFRTIAVAVTAVAQLCASPLTTLAMGPSSNTGAISDDNISPVTPAGYAFAIWGLIYLACVALAVYQLLPRQRDREVLATGNDQARDRARDQADNDEADDESEHGALPGEK